MQHTSGLAAQEILARFLPKDDPDVNLEFHKRISRKVVIDYRREAAPEGAFKYGKIKTTVRKLIPIRR